MDHDNPIVFVVDDDWSIRDSLSNLLGSAGLRVKTFASAQDFLASRRPQAPSCLVLDVQPPGWSGLDLQQELVRVGARLPIVFITGHGNVPMSVRAMRAEAIEFLTKPFRDNDLLNAVEQAIDRSRQLDFASRHAMLPQTEHFPMTDINEAFARLDSGKARYRIVLNAAFASRVTTAEACTCTELKERSHRCR